MLRLLIPFVFGLLVLIPPMTYIHWLGAPNSPPFWQYYLGFFRINPADLTGLQGTLTPAHLWFILYLFIFSLTALPLLLWLKTDAGLKFVSSPLSALERPGMLLVLGVPLTLAAALPILGDKNPIYYLFVFIAGFLLMVDQRFQRMLDRDRWVYLVLALLVTPVYIGLRRQFYFPVWSVGWIALGVVFNFLRWAWVLAILGLGYRYLNIDSAALRYCSEAAYPFYILHLPIDTLVGYWVIQWNSNLAVKYLSICVLTIGLTLAAYEFLVRRANATRFVFGMKPMTGPRIQPRATASVTPNPAEPTIPPYRKPPVSPA